MSPERFRQIEELYHAAREATADERAALLARADPELRHEVELLLAERNGGEFLDRPAIQDAFDLLEDSAAVTLAAGARLGPYCIEHKLGEGGMGEVFRAVDTRLGRAVAIKITHEQFSARFEREGRAIAALNHPNICTVHDVGPNYLVMELVEGETLAARLKRGPLPMDTALLYASQIVAALTEAHAKDIVHRDLKPGNIMIARSGIKVLDFGLAKSGQDQTVTVSPHGDGHAWLHGTRAAGRQTGRCALGPLFVRLRALRNVDGRTSGIPAEAHSVAKAGTDRQPVPRGRPRSTVAIRRGLTAGNGVDHTGQTRDARRGRRRGDSGRVRHGCILPPSTCAETH